MPFQCKIDKFSVPVPIVTWAFFLFFLLFTGPCSVACSSEESFQQTNSGGWEWCRLYD